jgi:hypothetical protein
MRAADIHIRIRIEIFFTFWASIHFAFAENTPTELLASTTLKWPQFQQEFETLFGQGSPIWKY